MILEEVVAWLTANKDDAKVLAFLDSLTKVKETELTSEVVAPFLDTQDGQKLIQSYVDRGLDKAIKTYKDNHFAQSVKEQVAAELLKLNPQETPEQRQIRELRETVESEKKARANDSLKRQLVEEAARMGVKTFWIDDYLPNSLDEGKLLLSKIKKENEDIAAGTAKKLLAEGHKPGGGNERHDDAPDVSKMTHDERMKHFTEIEEKKLAAEIKGQAQV